MTDDEIKGKEQMKAMRDEYCARTGCKPEDLQQSFLYDPEYGKHPYPSGAGNFQIDWEGYYSNISGISDEYKRSLHRGMANSTPETKEDKLRWELHVLDFKVTLLQNKVYWNRVSISFAYVCISVLAFIVAFK